MKKYILLTLSMVMLLSCFLFQTTVYANDNITLVIDCHEVETDVPPIIQNNRTLVPLRFVAEQLGFDVGWNAEERKAKISNRNTSVELQINNTLAIINKNMQHSTESLDVPPILYDNRTMVPVRFISEIMNYRVDWDGDNKTVIIYSGIRECTYEPPIPMPEPFVQEKIDDGNITEEVKRYFEGITLDNTNYTITSKLIHEGSPMTGQLVKKGNTTTTKIWLNGVFTGYVVTCDVKTKACTSTETKTNKKYQTTMQESQVAEIINGGTVFLSNVKEFISASGQLHQIYPNKAFSHNSASGSKLTVLINYDTTKKTITSTDMYLEASDGSITQMTITK